MLCERIRVGTNIINLIQQREKRHQREVEFRDTQKKEKCLGCYQGDPVSARLYSLRHSDQDPRVEFERRFCEHVC